MQRRSVLGALSAGTLMSASGASSAQTTAPAVPALRDLSSPQLAALMGVGWNLGNSLEAIGPGGETAWGNPKVTPPLLAAVRQAGFKTVRIPVAWKQYANAEDIISPAWLARVSEVVGYAQAAGLYTIINVHWDGGWLQPTLAAKDGANARLAKYWTQIAQHFKDHDHSLLFAGTNEVMVDGDWGPPKPEYAAVQNGFNQIFVDTVRASGGHNAQRHLIVQGFNTNIEHTLAFAVLPRDSARQRLMMEVHYYDPFNFAINEKSALWQWGAGATDPKAKDSWGDEAWVDSQFEKMKHRFVDQGVPVIVGEFGVIARSDIAGSEVYREAWNRHVAQSAVRHGLVPVYWDNGVTGQHGMGLFNRSTAQAVFPRLIKAVVGARP